MLIILTDCIKQQALLAEGRFFSDLELTEKEIERMVMEASRAEYLAEDKLKQQLGFRESFTSGAEPSSSGTSKLYFRLDFTSEGASSVTKKLARVSCTSDALQGKL